MTTIMLRATVSTGTMSKLFEGFAGKRWKLVDKSQTIGPEVLMPSFQPLKG